MSQHVREKLNISREEERALPLGEWVDANAEPVRSALKGRAEWQQRGYRTSPLLAWIIEGVVFGAGGTGGGSAPAKPAQGVTPAPAAVDEEDDDSSSSAGEIGGGIFGDDDGW